MESRTALEIERVAYDEFLIQWSQGGFAQQRLGQAFYNFFTFTNSRIRPFCVTSMRLMVKKLSP